MIKWKDKRIQKSEGRSFRMNKEKYHYSELRLLASGFLVLAQRLLPCT